MEVFVPINPLLRFGEEPPTIATRQNRHDMFPADALPRDAIIISYMHDPADRTMRVARPVDHAPTPSPRPSNIAQCRAQNMNVVRVLSGAIVVRYVGIKRHRWRPARGFLPLSTLAKRLSQVNRTLGDRLTPAYR